MVLLRRATAFILIFLISGCNYPSKPPAPTVDLVATAVTGTLAAEDIPTGQATNSVDFPLPHTVFFISDTSGSAQVWRLEADGATKSRFTVEPEAIDSYDVSRLDGSISYVTNNQLYLVDTDGSERRLLVDNSAADPVAADYFYRQRISDPRFSPNGRYLVYSFNGLWILDLSTYQATQLLVNEIEETESGVSPVAFYTPLVWAPDNQKIVVAIGESENSRLSFLNLSDAQFLTDFETSNGLFCCQIVWAPDGDSVLVGSPYIGLIEPGLWRYDANSGELTELVGVGEGGLFEFVGWPLQLADGSLRYFYTSSTEIPAADLPLFMMSSDGDGVSHRAELRPDSFSNIGEILWADDGLLALIVQLNPSGDISGSVVLAHSDGHQLQILLSDAQQLKWGP